MTFVGWLFSFAWPVIVVLIYSFVVDGTLKQRAKVTTDHFNMTGKALVLIDNSIEEIKKKLRSYEDRNSDLS